MCENSPYGINPFSEMNSGRNCNLVIIWGVCISALLYFVFMYCPVYYTVDLQGASTPPPVSGMEMLFVSALCMPIWYEDVYYLLIGQGVETAIGLTAGTFLYTLATIYNRSRRKWQIFIMSLSLCYVIVFYYNQETVSIDIYELRMTYMVTKKSSGYYALLVSQMVLLYSIIYDYLHSLAFYAKGSRKKPEK